MVLPMMPMLLKLVFDEVAVVWTAQLPMFVTVEGILIKGNFSVYAKQLCPMLSNPSGNRT